MSERIEKNGKEFFEDSFRQFGIPIKFVKGFESPLGETYFFDLENIGDYNENNLKDIIKKLSVFSHLTMTFQESKETHFAIFVRNDEKIDLSLYDLLKATNGEKFIIGVDNKGDMVELDFDEAPHLLIAGTTGSGKSILLHNILVNLLGVKRQRKLEILIIDPKGSEFREYKGHIGINFIDTTHEALDYLKRCEVAMDKRYKLENPLSDHDIFVLIDELADLMITSKGEVETTLVRLAQKGRACGIHLIIATQYPKATIFSPLIRANISNRIVLKTATSVESIVALGHKGCEKLRGKGDCIVKMGLEERHTQVAYPERELEQYVINL